MLCGPWAQFRNVARLQGKKSQCDTVHIFATDGYKVKHQPEPFINLQLGMTHLLQCMYFLPHSNIQTALAVGCAKELCNRRIIVAVDSRKHGRFAELSVLIADVLLLCLDLSFASVCLSSLVPSCCLNCKDI